MKWLWTLLTFGCQPGLVWMLKNKNCTPALTEFQVGSSDERNCLGLPLDFNRP